jgi:4'-phosphopantetheinyl transferase EntD
LVAAVACKASQIAGIGIDAEPLQRIPPLMAPHFLTESELHQAEAAREMGLKDVLGALWCAKEAIFKCIHPLTGVFLRFTDVAVHVDEASLLFTVEPLSPRGYQAGVTRLRGAIGFSQTHVCATSHIPVSHT